MLRIAAVAGLIVAGVINLLPLPGVLGAGWLKSLYGLDVVSADLEILLRHRAVLFGLFGALLLLSVAQAGLRTTAIALAGASMASFLVLALLVGGYGPAITRVVIADVVGLAALIPATLARFNRSSI